MLWECLQCVSRGGFHHSYIYVDERKEKLAKMEEDAKRELGMLPEKEFSPEDIRGEVH